MVRDADRIWIILSHDSTWFNSVIVISHWKLENELSGQALKQKARRPVQAVQAVVDGGLDKDRNG